jgi:serine/threonine-protein kinase HipA
MDLTLELYFEGEWYHAATLQVAAAEAGYLGQTTLNYEMQYFADVGSIPFAEGRPLHDARAISVSAPVDLEDRSRDTWQPFLLDLLPQGLQRNRIAAHLKIDADSRASDIHLLLHGAGSPVGNLRIKEARDEELKRVGGRPRQGVSMKDILERTERFLEVADRYALLASVSSGLQGNWPKIAMTKAADGLWYPDSAVGDADAREHVIVKFTRSNEAVDEQILRSEAAYSAIAQEFGLLVHGTSTYGTGVLVVPRFDRAVGEKGLTRFGQESFVSAIGVSDFNHLDTHENYLCMLREVSSDPQADVTEYVLRDVLNLAMGNPDNHGRNTALRKDAEGGIRISPLFDFAPMKLSPATIIRSTKWECMRADGRDYNPDWKMVCEAAAGDALSADGIVERLAAIEDAVRSLPETGRKHGLPDEVVERAFSASEAIADGIAAMKLTPVRGVA